MAAHEIAAAELGHPRFSFAAAGEAAVFALDSHRRAKEALDLGIAVAGPGFNIFVVGEDRAGRMTATLAYLEAAMATRPPPGDWVYLNNFRHPENPTPHRLPAGAGRRLRDRLAGLVRHLREALAKAFTSESYQSRLLALREAAQRRVGSELETLRQAAQAQGIELVQGEDGALRLRRAEAAPEGKKPEGEAPEGQLAESAEREMNAALARFHLHAMTMQTQLAAQVTELNRAIAEEVGSGLIEETVAEFSAFPGLARWLTELRVDILDDPTRFARGAEPEKEDGDTPERRYAVNLLVDRGEAAHPAVVLESNPSYENLFGRIEYRQARGTIETDFTLIRPGALHLANGGILVLRAEALAVNPMSWVFLKAALRDSLIRIEEPLRAGAPPIAGAPKPGPIPLDLKVVIIGAPRWYETFFNGDPDFQTHFKVKADIDADMTASPENLGIYAALIDGMARGQRLEGAEPAAIGRLLGIAARWADRRDRLTARFELIEDLVIEAAARAHEAGRQRLDDAALAETLAARRRRNTRIEDRVLRAILEGAVMIETEGAAIGQVNALSVQGTGDRRFGTPMRVTARASVGRAGIVNIERDVALGGPIQQKGAMVLQGFLAGHFAQLRPLSFTCSITFEQNYGGVEGDSASLAELVAVLSELSRLPVRQDVAITGSVNQTGRSQAVGGVRWKVEGFYRVCAAQPGGLSGTQGVIVPQANLCNLVLHDEVAEAVAAGRFRIWSAASVEDAAELLLQCPAGIPDSTGAYPADSIYGRVAARLAEFDRILAAREAALRG